MTIHQGCSASKIAATPPLVNNIYPKIEWTLTTSLHCAFAYIALI